MATSPISGGAIDVNSIVSQLIAVEREPINRLQSNASAVRSTISEFGKLQSALDKFRSAARDLNSRTTWGASTGSSADDQAVGISAATGALKGSFSVRVEQLASHQTIVSAALPDAKSVIGGGSLTIELGSAVGGFAPDPERPAVTINIAPGATLEQVGAAINAAGAGVGASLVTDSRGTRLMIRSSDSGEEQAFRLSATTDGTSTTALSLASLAYAPGQAAGTVTATQQAANARFELNGLPLESATNRPEGVLENVSLSLNKVTSAPIELEIGSDSEAIRGRLDAFVTAYNELNSLIRTQTRYDAETQTAGPLQGNRMVLLVQSQLRDILRTTLPAAQQDPGDPQPAGTLPPFTRLSDIGLEVQRDGSLSIDENRLEVAASDPRRLEQLFSAGGTDSSTHGFARRFDRVIGNLLDADGAINGATQTLRRREESLTDQEERMERRLEDLRERLVRQYSALDANLGRLGNALGSLNNIGR